MGERERGDEDGEEVRERGRAIKIEKESEGGEQIGRLKEKRREMK
jgi:hypothetical protein